MGQESSRTYRRHAAHAPPPFDRLEMVSGVSVKGQQWREWGQKRRGGYVKKGKQTGFTLQGRPRKNRRGTCNHGEDANQPKLCIMCNDAQLCTCIIFPPLAPWPMVAACGPPWRLDQYESQMKGGTWFPERRVTRVRAAIPTCFQPIGRGDGQLVAPAGVEPGAGLVGGAGRFCLEWSTWEGGDGGRRCRELPHASTRPATRPLQPSMPGAVVGASA